VRDVGRPFEGDVAVARIGAVVRAAQEVCGAADVAQREREEQRLRVAQPAGEQLVELVVVTVAGGERCGEDRGVRRHAAQPMLGHVALEDTILEQRS
jgi:hypothetical protein